MKNGFKIIWSKRASRDLAGLSSYLESRWTDRELRNFFRNLEKHLKIIQENPNLFQKSRLKGVRRCVLSRQTSLYYRVKGKTVAIVTLFDNRQHPDKL
jgi:plasmid stabilization system protein ParE